MVKLILEINEKERRALKKSQDDVKRLLKKTKERTKKLVKKVSSSFQVRVVKEHGKKGQK